MNILCLYVRHGTRAHSGGLAVLDDWYRTHGLLEHRELWIIDNGLNGSSAAKTTTPRTTTLAGDNRAWEFSAWERTIREFGPTIQEFDAVHFVTSAFNTLYTDYLGHFRRGMLTNAIARGVCLGHIDSYGKPVGIADRRSASWLRTCFFFLPPKHALRVEPWAPFADPAEFFVSPSSTEFRTDAPISEDYRHRIRIWLEGHEVGGNRWHSPIRSGEAEADRFQRKTLAIVNEHRLSITLREMGIPLVDFCWFWSQKSENDPLDPLPPDEASQLAVRRRILGIPD